MSAFGSKADMPFCTAHVCFWFDGLGPLANIYPIHSIDGHSAFRGLTRAVGRTLNANIIDNYSCQASVAERQK